MVSFQHPAFLIISFVCAWIYHIKRNGWVALALQGVLLPAAAAFALYYSSYHHFGVTVLQKNLIGNAITMESLVYGAVLGITVAGVCHWMCCIWSVFTTDKVVYLFGKASPRLSLFLAVGLRLGPRVRKEAKRIHTAQQGIGRGIHQGSVFRRMGNALRIGSMLINWTIEAMITASESMRSRGSQLRGRTAFSIYRFDNRDRGYVIGQFACMTLVMMAILLKQTDVVYDPRIIITPITPVSYVFYAGYAIFCLMPLMLECWTEYRFQKAWRSL